MNNIIKKIKEYFTYLKNYFDVSSYAPQQIGSILIVLSLIFTLTGLIWWALGTLLGIGLFDLVLYLMKKKTISQWIHRLFPKAIDIAIGILILVFTWMICGPEIFLPILVGFILGHLFWQE